MKDEKCESLEQNEHFKQVKDKKKLFFKTKIMNQLTNVL